MSAAPILFRHLKSWLLWTMALAPAPAFAQVLAPPPPPAPRFAQDIAAFAAIDQASPPGACPVVFVGSSSIRLWSSLAIDMAPLPVLNRGFGGAEIEDVNRYFDQLLTAYRPRAIVFYAGENDLDAGKTPDRIVADFQAFLDLKSRKLGATPVFFTSVKPSLLRFEQFAAQSEVNGRIRALADERADLTYLDVVPLMLQDGRPKAVFLPDGLHLAPEGYALWKSAIGGALLADHIDALPCTPPAPDMARSDGRTGPG